MRLSTDSSDPGYPAWRALPSSAVAVVTIDGKPVSRCITADTETGYVLEYVLDDAGNHVLNDDRSEAKLRESYGVVRISIKDRESVSTPKQG